MKRDPEIRDESPFLLSIEPKEGDTRLHPFHLGTDETVAREFAIEIWMRNSRLAHGARTVALLRDRKIVDVWDGDDWYSKQINDWFDEAESYLSPPGPRLMEGWNR